MSKALYGIETLRFYSEEEIELREQFTTRLTRVVKETLTNLNRAWTFKRVEGPLLTPRSFVSSSYDEDDIFVTQIKKANDFLVLRPETTKSSYLFASESFNIKKLPLCVWQLGKSFRVEKSDGATASKLRFNEFYQLEFQCIYSEGTKAPYRENLIEAISNECSYLLNNATMRIIDSDRLPSYSKSTKDIETMWNNDFKEIASCSLRTDFLKDTEVTEIAIGIDRMLEIYLKNRGNINEC